MSLRILLVLLVACSAPEAAAPPAATTPTPAAPADPVTCTSSAQCASGFCEGEGCTDDKPGICVPETRRCTRDRRPYCGCDGQTFETSGSCPGRRYRSRGACAPM